MRFAPRLLIVAVITLGSVACGVKGGDSAITPKPSEDAKTTTTTSRDNSSTTTEAATPPVDDEALQALSEAYLEMGFTEDEASCLAEQISSMANVDPSDTSALMDMINECDIPMSRLTEITGNLGGTDPDEAYKNSFAAGLKASGLSDSEADCVAEAFVEEFGVDPSKAADLSALTSLFTQCGVDPTKIGG